jgi:hypothetical protein
MEILSYRVLEDKDIAVTYQTGEEYNNGELHKILIPGMDISEEPEEIQKIVNELWTQEVIFNYKTKWNII